MSKRMFVVTSWQMYTTAVVYLFPIFMLCLLTLIDTTSIPGMIYAPMRSLILLLFCLNPTQASLVFILKNPIHMQHIKEMRIAMWNTLMRIFHIRNTQGVRHTTTRIRESTFTTA
ncbi:hypothetical protein PMAYCL1PPCAC_15773, partial [Pristionchus mayeri]